MLCRLAVHFSMYVRYFKVTRNSFRNSLLEVSFYTMVTCFEVKIRLKMLFRSMTAIKIIFSRQISFFKREKDFDQEDQNRIFSLPQTLESSAALLNTI